MKDYRKVAMFAQDFAELEMNRIIRAYPRDAKKNNKTIEQLNREIAELSAIIAEAKEMLEDKFDAE